MTASPETLVHHPFAETMKLRIDERSPGRSTCSIEVAPDIHHNPHQVAHGAVLYALADTGMGTALYPTLNDGEICVTIEIKITYFRPAPRASSGARQFCSTAGGRSQISIPGSISMTS